MIIAIDDNEAILEAVQIALESAGYTVETSTKGVSFVPRMRILRPKVVLLDFLLSGEDGGDVIREMKNHLETKDIPIIILSAHPGAEVSVGEYGVTDFIPKPFDLDMLLDKVKEYEQRN